MHSETPRIIVPVINSQNPLYRSQMCEAMFDQSRLPKDKRTLPQRRFQKAVFALSTQYKVLNIVAPSQSGKTTATEQLAATLLYEWPACKILILSTREEQANRLLQNIRENYISCHRVPELRRLDQKGGDSASKLILEHSRSQVIAVPHSMRALTGNPANVVIIDEFAYFDKEDPSALYAQAMARVGNMDNSLILTISTFNGESQVSPQSNAGYTGNYFHAKWTQSWRLPPEIQKTSPSTSIKLSYHASPKLTANIDYLYRESLASNHNSEKHFLQHYLSLPTQAEGTALFGIEFNRDLHVKPLEQVHKRVTPTEPLFLCFDPGVRMQAAVLGQFDPTTPTLIYLASFSAQGKSLEDFVRSTWSQVRRRYPNFDTLVFADPAAKQTNRQTLDPDSQIIARATNLPDGGLPIMIHQPIETGVKLLKSYLARHNGVLIADTPENKDLITAFEHGCIAETRNGQPIDKYKKDGFFEHYMDTARYPVIYLTQGLTPESFQQHGAASDAGYYYTPTYY